MRRLRLLLALVVPLTACGDRPPAPAEDAAAAESAAGARGVFFTLQGEGAVGTLAGERYAAGMTEPTYLDISPDGRHLLVSIPSEDRVYLLDAGTGAVLDTIAVGRTPKHVRFSPWAGIAYVANEGSGTVGMIALRERAMVEELAVGTGPHGLEADAGSELLYVTLAGENAIAVIDLEMFRVMEKVPVPGTPDNLDLSSTDGLLYISLREPREVIRFNFATREVDGRAAVGGEPSGVAVSPDGRWVYVTGPGTTLHILDAGTMAVAAHVEVGQDPVGVAANAAGDEVYVAVAGTGEVVVVDALTRAIKRREAVGSRPFWLVARD